MANRYLQGYISSISDGRTRVPQSVQNLVIREYCRGIGAEFVLSATEYDCGGRDNMFRDLLNNQDGNDGVVFYSVRMLGRDWLDIDTKLGQLIDSGLEAHFALEKFEVCTHKQKELWKDLVLLISSGIDG